MSELTITTDLIDAFTNAKDRAALEFLHALVERSPEPWHRFYDGLDQVVRAGGCAGGNDKTGARTMLALCMSEMSETRGPRKEPINFDWWVLDALHELGGRCDCEILTVTRDRVMAWT